MSGTATDEAIAYLSGRVAAFQFVSEAMRRWGIHESHADRQSMRVLELALALAIAARGARCKTCGHWEHVHKEGDSVSCAECECFGFVEPDQ